MLFALLKKEFMLTKKYVPLMFSLVIFLPPVLRWTIPSKVGTFFGFVLSILISSTIMLHYLSLKECQFPKAATLLCATPISRRQIVLSKYIFCMVVYGACCITLIIVSLVVPKLGTADIKLFALMFLFISTFVSIYLPIAYKFGFENAKYAFAMIYAPLPFAMLELLRVGIFNLDFLSTLSPYLIYGGSVLIGFIVLVVSAFLSIKIYDKADLV